MSACNLQVYATGPVDTYFGPTGQSTIDYILVPRACEHLVEKCIVKGEEVLNTSDHNPVQVTLNFGSLGAIKNDMNKAKLKRWDKLSANEINEKYTSPLETCVYELNLTLSEYDFGNDELDDCISALIDKMV